LFEAIVKKIFRSFVIKKSLQYYICQYTKNTFLFGVEFLKAMQQKLLKQEKNNICKI
jgi:hypothetical protein